ncbi:MarR family transcriptional regulator [Patescibacteria group bacterium]|nr:MarR family transcriptional regulator [Patescibacteria group bacterium]MCG2687377.1 MarR family transcriptional regulator [Candidatus Parcubacteria bacterium]
MNEISENVNFLLNLARTQSILIKRFDRGMGNGIGFNEFLLLFYLDRADNQTMRRVDLAEKIGVTASGITRMLLPMEKIGLINTSSVSDDARVKSVSLSKGGKEKFDDALLRFTEFAEEISSNEKASDISSSSILLSRIGGSILMS